MRRWTLLIVLVILTAGCDGAGQASSTTSEPTTTTTSTTTTTVDPSLTCDDIAAQAADLMRRMVDEVGDTDAAELADPQKWSDELVELQSEGRDLDVRIAATGCDPGTIQAAALAAVEGMAPHSRSAEILLEVLTGR